MRNYLFILIFFFCFSTQAALLTKIQPLEAKQGEVFYLTITQEGSPSQSPPDLTPLQKDFTVVHTQHNMHYTNINGKANIKTEWKIGLLSKKTGVLTIPTIAIGQQRTSPLQVSITQDGPKTPNLPPPKGENKNIFLKTDVDNMHPYINQQVRYTVKIFSSVSILDAQYQPPHLDNALLITLDHPVQSEEIYKGRLYTVKQQSYAIFPQKSGTLAIHSPVFTALTYKAVPEKITLRNKDINLSVEPAPVNSLWLPAQKLQLQQHYEHLKDTYRAGDTLVRTVTMQAKGMPAQLLPSLTFENTASFQVYPGETKSNNTLGDGHIIGKTTVAVTYVFNKAGDITIPELKLPWFNTLTHKTEMAILPHHTLHILPSTKSPTTSFASNSSSLSSSAEKKTSFSWKGFLLILITTVALLLIWHFKKQKKNQTIKKIRYESLLKTLKKACLKNQAPLARDALLQWGAYHWPKEPFLHLQDLTKLLPDENLKKQVENLSFALYSAHSEPWKGRALWRALSKWRKPTCKKSKKMFDLPPINP